MRLRRMTRPLDAPLRPALGSPVDPAPQRGVFSSTGEGYVDPPPRMPWLLGLALRLVAARLGGRLVANRILVWYPKALIGSGVMEALVAHDDPEVPKRLLKLLRVQVSFLASCPFCIDLNAKEYRESGITDEEILALRGLGPLGEVRSLSAAEAAALEYARCATATPVAFSSEVIEGMKRQFSERAMVIIASTVAQVNFWTRLIQSLGVQPAGFSKECAILDLEGHRTLAPPAAKE
jgi:alkylhydroperoxidase family enzyme